MDEVNQDLHEMTLPRPINSSVILTAQKAKRLILIYGLSKWECMMYRL